MIGETPLVKCIERQNTNTRVAGISAGDITQTQKMTNKAITTANVARLRLARPQRDGEIFFVEFSGVALRPSRSVTHRLVQVERAQTKHTATAVTQTVHAFHGSAGFQAKAPPPQLVNKADTAITELPITMSRR